MVVFVCEGCQESVRNPSVEKHASSCRSCFVLTCVDCSVSFEGDAYRAHVTCVSEAQKYEGGLYKPKGGGKRDPQAEWLGVIAAAAAGATRHKDLLQRLLAYSNVPRKPKPFVAFAKNSLRVFNDRILEELFAAIQAHAPPRPAQPGREEAAAAAVEAAAAAVADAPTAGADGGPGAPLLAQQGDIAVRASGSKRRRAAEEAAGAEGGGGAVEGAAEGAAGASVWGRGLVEALVAAAGERGVKASSLQRAAARAGAAAGLDDAECAHAVTQRVARLLKKGRLRVEGGRYFCR